VTAIQSKYEKGVFNQRGLTMRWSQPPAVAMTSSHDVYEVRPRKDKRGIDLISDALPFGRLVV